jgi:hypothetical protein
MKILVTALATAAVTAGAAYAASTNGRLFHPQPGDWLIAGKIICHVDTVRWEGPGSGVKCGLASQGPGKVFAPQDKVFALTNTHGVTIIVGGKLRYVCRTDGHCVTNK